MADPLSEAAALAERRDLGNIPAEPVPAPDDDAHEAAAAAAPEPEPEPEPEQEPESRDVVALRQQLEASQRELELARAAYRQPVQEPAPPTYTAENILPFQVSPDVLAQWGLPAEAAGQVNDMFKMAALAAKEAAKQELRHEYQQMQVGQQRAQQLRTHFYDKYPELEKHQLFVGHAATQVQQLYPNMPANIMLPLIADTAREQVKAAGLPLTPPRARRRRPAGSDSSGSSAGVRPNGQARGSYSDRLGSAMDAFAEGRR